VLKFVLVLNRDISRIIINVYSKGFYGLSRKWECRKRPQAAIFISQSPVEIIYYFITICSLLAEVDLYHWSEIKWTCTGTGVFSLLAGFCFISVIQENLHLHGNLVSPN